MADRLEVQNPDVTRRHQEIAPGEFAPEVYAVNAVTAAVAQQRFFIAGSQKLELAVTGNFRGLISNPTGSGRKLLVVRMVALATVTAWMDLRLNPTTGLPVGARTPFNAVLGGAAASGTLRADTDATVPLGGGALLSPTLALPPNSRQSVDLPPLVLMPGVSLGMNINSGAGAAAFSLYWIEEDL